VRAALAVTVLILVAACASGDEPLRAGDLDERFEVAGVNVTILGGAIATADGVDVDLRELVESSIAAVADAIDVPPVRVIVRVEPSQAIPGIGVGGFADPRTGDVSVALDPAHDPFDDALRHRIPDVLAHELHHSTRILRGPGYGRSLAEAFVTEGLAQRFVVEAFPDVPLAPWADALTPDEERETWDRAQDALDETYSWELHEEWFFGTGDVPHWAGYTIGFNIVGFYLQAENTTAAAAVTAAGDEILERSGYAP